MVSEAFLNTAFKSDAGWHLADPVTEPGQGWDLSLYD